MGAVKQAETRLIPDEEEYLRSKLASWFTDENPTYGALYGAGITYPLQPPALWNALPEEWSRLMETNDMTALKDVDLENYLEKWLRLLGYAYFVQSVWQDRVDTLTRLSEFTKDYIFQRTTGNREEKAALSNAHPIHEEVLNHLNDWSRKLGALNGVIKQWEKIEFTISRTITNRQNRPSR